MLCPHLVACKHVFNEYSFSLMETLVNGSVLRPVGGASRILRVSLYESVCLHAADEGVSDVLYTSAVS